jgi:hypothetical protein
MQHSISHRKMTTMLAAMACEIHAVLMHAGIRLTMLLGVVAL